MHLDHQVFFRTLLPSVPTVSKFLPFQELWLCCYCGGWDWRLREHGPAATEGTRGHRVGNSHETVIHTWTLLSGEGKQHATKLFNLQLLYRSISKGNRCSDSGFLWHSYVRQILQNTGMLKRLHTLLRSCVSSWQSTNSPISHFCCDAFSEAYTILLQQTFLKHDQICRFKKSIHKIEWWI